MTCISTIRAHYLAWKETTPGNFRRPLDTIESFFKWIADLGMPVNLEHWAVSLALRLDLPDCLPPSQAEPYIRRAWLILSKQHPMLYARPNGSTVTVSPLDEDKWLKESFFAHAGEHTALDSLFTSIDPVPFMSCHWVPSIGSIKLADRLLAALCAVVQMGPAVPIESYGLDLTPLFTPSLDDVSNAYPDEESTPPAVQKVADNLLQSVLKGAPSIGLPVIPGTEKALPDPSARVRVLLDKHTTSAIVKACKSRGIKVTSTVHAAMVQAVAAHPQHPLAKHYCITTAAGMRRRLPSGKRGDGPELAAGMFISPSLVFIEDPAAGAGKAFA